MGSLTFCFLEKIDVYNIDGKESSSYLYNVDAEIVTEEIHSTVANEYVDHDIPFTTYSCSLSTHFDEFLVYLLKRKLGESFANFVNLS